MSSAGHLAYTNAIEGTVLHGIRESKIRVKEGDARGLIALRDNTKRESPCLKALFVALGTARFLIRCPGKIPSYCLRWRKEGKVIIASPTTI